MSAQQVRFSNLSLIFLQCDNVISPQSKAFVGPFPDGSKWRLCVCIHNLLMDSVWSCVCALMRPYFPIPPPQPWGELAMWWSLAVIYKRSISVVPVIAPRFLVTPNLSCQLVRGFQKSATIQVICGSGFHFTQFRAFYRFIPLLVVCTDWTLILLFILIWFKLEHSIVSSVFLYLFCFLLSMWHWRPR